MQRVERMRVICTAAQRDVRRGHSRIGQRRRPRGWDGEWVRLRPGPAEGLPRRRGRGGSASSCAARGGSPEATTRSSRRWRARRGGPARYRVADDVYSTMLGADVAATAWPAETPMPAWMPLARERSLSARARERGGGEIVVVGGSAPDAQRGVALSLLTKPPSRPTTSTTIARTRSAPDESRGGRSRPSTFDPTRSTNSAATSRTCRRARRSVSSAARRRPRLLPAEEVAHALALAQARGHAVEPRPGPGRPRCRRRRRRPRRVALLIRASARRTSAAGRRRPWRRGTSRPARRSRRRRHRDRGDGHSSALAPPNASAWTRRASGRTAARRSRTATRGRAATSRPSRTRRAGSPDASARAVTGRMIFSTSR